MRLVLRPEYRGLLVEALDGGRLGLRRQAGEIRIGGSTVRRFGCPARGPFPEATAPSCPAVADAMSVIVIVTFRWFLSRPAQ